MGILFAAFALIPDEFGQVLLKLRRDLDIWDLPGGCAEEDDFHAGSRQFHTACLKREVREETGLRVEALAPFGLFLTEAILHDTPSVQAVYICRIVDGSLKANDEAAEFGWFGTKLPKNTFEIHRCLIEHWRRTGSIRTNLAQQGLFLGGDLRGLVDTHREVPRRALA